MTITYNNLPEWSQEFIDDVRILIGDLDPDAADRFFSDDQWVVIFQAAIRDFNRARPHTDFTVDSFPEGLADIIELGVMYHAALSRSNHLMEEVPVQGYTGPYVDFSQLYARWGARAAELAPEWRKMRNKAKMLFLPSPAGTVDSFSYYGRSASVIPYLRTLPSWSYNRG